jgi:Gas vesicle synthesis protein GvpL/GvpF
VSVLYLYAVIGEQPRRDPGRGLGQERLRVLSGRGFRVVAGSLRATPAATPAALRRHDAVVRRIAGTVDAILPIRFGSVVADATAAARLLAPRASELGGRLGQVRGHEQMTLRLFDTRGPGRPRAGVADRAARRGLGPGARYLAARRHCLDPGGDPALGPLRALLHELVADERVQRHATPPLVASVYHLVPRDRRAQYRRRVARAAATLAPLRLTVSGPWPPYAFGADAWP